MVGLAFTMWAISRAWRAASGRRVGVGGRLVMGVVAALYVMVV